MNLEGRLLGNRYEIIRQIGNGGMATVYKAKCHVLNRFVAVKVLKDEYTTDSEFIKRFNVEAQAVASLTHPNIVSVYDVGKEDNLYYIVMELVQGKTLKEIIKEDGALSWKWSVNVAIQIASALEAAHKNNIVHRDIKPHNIIITEDGIAKVTDFGIAKAVSNSTITAFGTTIGSVHYFSPEHARGGYTDAKSDIYSLGVVLYEMLTGRVPFDADTPVSVALKHMHEQPVEPIKINPSIPISVNKIVLKAMQKDPNDRYSTATEMLRDLNTALKNPDGDFVRLNKVQNDFPTQHMPLIYDKTLEEKIKERDDQRNYATQVKTKKQESKIAKFFKTHKVTGVLTIILAAILLFVIVMMITMSAMKIGITPEVEIPDLVKMSKEENKTVEELQQYVQSLKLKIEVEEEYNAEVEAGKIIKQEPTSGITYDNRKKTDKEGFPYLGHLERVSRQMSTLEGKVAALLHDTIEDIAYIDYDDLLDIGIPTTVIEVIKLVTNDPKVDSLNLELRLERYHQKITSIIESGNPLAIELKYADMSDNYNPERLQLCSVENRVWLTRKYEPQYKRLKKAYEKIKKVEKRK